MFACFREMQRVLAADGVLTVMFTHKQVEAWDTLGAALIKAGFRIDASWPVNTESDTSLHQAKKNAASSTILLVCRKREKSCESVWWKISRPMSGQPLDRKRPSSKSRASVALTSTSARSAGAVDHLRKLAGADQRDRPEVRRPAAAQAGRGARPGSREVINLRKQGLLLGRSVEFDPLTDWYLMAWDAFRAQEFPADEAGSSPWPWDWTWNGRDP